VVSTGGGSATWASLQGGQQGALSGAPVAGTSLAATRPVAFNASTSARNSPPIARTSAFRSPMAANESSFGLSGAIAFASAGSLRQVSAA
jgi:hypothetical protein